jgi:hypothetical protein
MRVASTGRKRGWRSLRLARSARMTMTAAGMKWSMNTQRGPAVRAGDLAAALGKGLVAGLAGTAAMTVSSTLESWVRDRQSSDTPARAASRVLGVAPVDAQGERRFNQLVHWGYGAGWGTVHGLLAAVGLAPGARTAAHAAAVWAGEQVVLPATGVAEPATQWPPAEVAIDVWHHVIYATATGLAYAWLDRR